MAGILFGRRVCLALTEYLGLETCPNGYPWYKNIQELEGLSKMDEELRAQ